MKKFKINSLRVEKYVAKIEKGNKNIICTRYVFNCIEGEKNYELQLYYKYNENYFGEAILNLKEVKCFSGVSY